MTPNCVSGESYHNMITEILWPALIGMNLDEMCFYQDGITNHPA